MSLYHILKNAFNVGIEHLHGQFATLGSLEYGLILLVLTRLQHIVASKHRSYGIVASIPVAHKHTLPAPLVANDSSKQFTILHSVWTIQLISEILEFYSNNFICKCFETIGEYIIITVYKHDIFASGVF